MRITKTIKNFAREFNKNGFELYLVGGAVRDEYMGLEAHDYDFATNATPEEMMSIFRRTVPVGIDHGTVLILYGEESFEVTTFRTESDYTDNRHPDKVVFVRNIAEDLSRRDFTINALAYSVTEEKLIDLFDGKSDCQRKIIRAIGDANQRFQEDALRMLRGCRFAAKLGFSVESATKQAMMDNKDLIKNISSERIRDELIKLMQTAKPSIGIELMRETGLLDIILPELMEGYQFEQNKFHKYDVYYHNLYSCDAALPDNWEVRLAALLHDIAKPRTSREKGEDGNSFYNHEIIGSRMSRKILRRLKFSTATIDKIVHLVKHHMFYYTKEWTDGAVRRFLRNVGVENLPELFALRDADRLGNGSKTGIPKTFIDFQDKIKEIIEIDSALKVTDLDINGRDLMAEVPLKEGPIIGEVLNYLLELVLDMPELNTHEQLLEKAKEYYQKKHDYAMENYGKPPEELGKF